MSGCLCHRAVAFVQRTALACDVGLRRSNLALLRALFRNDCWGLRSLALLPRSGLCLCGLKPCLRIGSHNDAKVAKVSISAVTVDVRVRWRPRRFMLSADVADCLELLHPCETRRPQRWNMHLRFRPKVSVDPLLRWRHPSPASASAFSNATKVCLEETHLATLRSSAPSGALALGRRTGECVDVVGALHLDRRAAAKSHRAHHRHVAATAPSKRRFARLQCVHDPRSFNCLGFNGRCEREFHQQRHCFGVAQRRRRCHGGGSDSGSRRDSCHCIAANAGGRWCCASESRHRRGNALEWCSVARVATKHVESFFSRCTVEAHTQECCIELRAFEGVEVGDFDDLARQRLDDG